MLVKSTTHCRISRPTYIADYPPTGRVPSHENLILSLIIPCLRARRLPWCWAYNWHEQSVFIRYFTLMISGDLFGYGVVRVKVDGPVLLPGGEEDFCQFSDHDLMNYSCGTCCKSLYESPHMCRTYFPLTFCSSMPTS